MGILEDTFSTIFNPNIMSDIGEKIYYVVKDGSEKELYGFIFRNKGGFIFGNSVSTTKIAGASGSREEIVVKISRNADIGVVDVKENEDSVKIKLDLGDTVYKQKIIRKIIGVDACSYTLALG